MKLCNRCLADHTEIDDCASGAERCGNCGNPDLIERGARLVCEACGATYTRAGRWAGWEEE
jgi:hypothetical protein